jgi:hypothetical protein
LERLAGQIEAAGTLERLAGQIEAAGTLEMCLTQSVLHDLEVEDKEHFLCHHSEKIFRLISLPHETPIQVIENLHVCCNCHTAIKKYFQDCWKGNCFERCNCFHLFKHSFILGEIR